MLFHGTLVIGSFDYISSRIDPHMNNTSICRNTLHFHGVSLSPDAFTVFISVNDRSLNLLIRPLIWAQLFRFLGSRIINSLYVAPSRSGMPRQYFLHINSDLSNGWQVEWFNRADNSGTVTAIIPNNCHCPYEWILRLSCNFPHRCVLLFIPTIISQISISTNYCFPIATVYFPVSSICVEIKFFLLSRVE